MTTGPEDDIGKATRIARKMVTQWGMSDRLGPRTFGRKEEMIFLGREISEQRDYSEKVAEEIDEEVRRLIDKAYHTAKDVLTAHRDKLEDVVQRILVDETLEGDELTRLLEAPVGAASVSIDEGPAAPPPAGAPPTEAEAKPEKPKRRRVAKPKLELGGQTAAKLDPEPNPQP
jgi:cell division protease FtsH